MDWWDHDRLRIQTFNRVLCKLLVVMYVLLVSSRPTSQIQVNVNMHDTDLVEESVTSLYAYQVPAHHPGSRVCSSKIIYLLLIICRWQKAFFRFPGASLALILNHHWAGTRYLSSTSMLHSCYHSSKEKLLDNWALQLTFIWGGVERFLMQHLSKSEHYFPTIIRNSVLL